MAQLVIDENVENPEYVTVTINDEFVENHELLRAQFLKKAMLLNSYTSWEEEVMAFTNEQLERYSAISFLKKLAQRDRKSF